jgi:hypothetical protein
MWSILFLKLKFHLIPKIRFKIKIGLLQILHFYKKNSYKTDGEVIPSYYKIAPNIKNYYH